MMDTTEPLEGPAERREVTFVIPAYNESAIIERNLDELHDWLAQNMAALDYEIVVVDDGSNDGMGDALDRYAAAHDRTHVAHHDRNRGRGRAIRTGFAHSTGRYVLCLDADLSYAPDHIPKLLTPLQTGGADITLASAYHPEGQVSNVPFSRALLSRWGNRVLSAGVKGQFRTVTCVVRGFRREVIDELELVNDGKDLHLEVIQKAVLFGLNVVEVPAHLQWRDKDRGKKQARSWKQRIPFLSMSGTILSHLLYNFLLRPGLMLYLPVFLLISTVLVGSGLIINALAQRLAGQAEQITSLSVYLAIRETLLQGNLTLFIVFFSLVLLMVFMAFYFASFQNRKNFEELYILSTRMNARLKRLEERLER